jgi:uncharacterized membrane protein YuzA (DUF378 family)
MRFHRAVLVPAIVGILGMEVVAVVVGEAGAYALIAYLVVFLVWFGSVTWWYNR